MSCLQLVPASTLELPVSFSGVFQLWFMMLKVTGWDGLPHMTLMVAVLWAHCDFSTGFSVVHKPKGPCLMRPQKCLEKLDTIWPRVNNLNMARLKAHLVRWCLTNDLICTRSFLYQIWHPSYSNYQWFHLKPLRIGPPFFFGFATRRSNLTSDREICWKSWYLKWCLITVWTLICWWENEFISENATKIDSLNVMAISIHKSFQWFPVHHPLICDEATELLKLPGRMAQVVLKCHRLWQLSGRNLQTALFVFFFNGTNWENR